MPVLVNCPNPACGKSFHVEETLLGKVVPCKACGRSFRLSSATPNSVETKTPVAPPSDSLGRIGRFELRQKLGRGAFGIVYRAYDPLSDREVALKVPNPDTVNTPQRIERFLREARALSRLQHPHIVPFYEAGQADGRYFIASAFIAGKSLAEVIREKGIDCRRAARIVKALAEALAYAHQQGIVHRDVKPSNVMLDEQDQPLLMDFGLAAEEEEGQEKLTRIGAVLGTPSYIAPENAEGYQGEAKPAADQYALGVILYELLTGLTPFAGPPMVILYHAVNTVPKPPRQLRPEVPADMEAICLKAMAKRTWERYPDCQALAGALGVWLDKKEVRHHSGKTLYDITESHLTSQQLAAIGTGHLTEEEATTVTAHLSVCTDCRRAAELFGSPSRRIPQGSMPSVAKPVAASSAHLPDWLQPMFEDLEAHNKFREYKPKRIEASAYWSTLLAVFLLFPILVLLFVFVPLFIEKLIEVSTNEKQLLPQETGKGITPESSPSKEFTNFLGMKFAWIPPGTFMMGSSPNEANRGNDETQHEVTLTKGFYMCVFEVTQGQWQQVMGINPSWFSSTGRGRDSVEGLDTSDFPVEQVSWEDVIEFCKKLSELPEQKRAGRVYRLPTEAEWEYSCRGGASSYQVSAFGDTLATSRANFNNVLGRTCKVGSYQPNGFGLFDMHGNVWEWCADWYESDYYRNSPRQDPPGPSRGSLRVRRGGSWLDDPRFCRSAIRYRNEPGLRIQNLGCRLALVPPSGKSR